MRCSIPVDLSAFPAGIHSKILAGTEHGFENCQVIFTRFPPGASPRDLVQNECERLIFVCSGELSVGVGSQITTVKAISLIRLPRGIRHIVWNDSADELLCVEILAPASGAAAENGSFDLEGAVVRFHGHAPIEKSSGFDFKFLASRTTGSANVAVNIARVLPGHRGPDFHIHNFDQFYFILRGQMTVDIGFDKFVANPFTLIRLPAGIVHRQGNNSGEPEVHLSIISPEPPKDYPLDYLVAVPSTLTPTTLDSKSALYVDI